MKNWQFALWTSSAVAICLMAGCAERRTESVIGSETSTHSRLFSDGRFGYLVEAGSVTLVADALDGTAPEILLLDSLPGNVEATRVEGATFVEVIASPRGRIEVRTEFNAESGITQTVTSDSQAALQSLDSLSGDFIATYAEATWQISATPPSSESEVPVLTRKVRLTTPTQSRPEAARLTILGSESDQELLDIAVDGLIDSTHPWYPLSFNPFGATSNGYEFHFYWDADIYMVPALLLLEPRRAATIARYRLDTLPQAKQNFDDWVASGMPTARQKQDSAVRLSQSAFRPAMYAWQSSADGVELGIGQTRRAHHLSGSVAFGVEMAAAFGLVDQYRSGEVLRSVSSFYLLRASRREDGLYTIADTVSPDEWTITDADLYTNAIAERYARINNPRIQFLRPRDEHGYLNFEGEIPPLFKQESGLLAAFPLQDPLVEAEAMKMLERFGSRISPAGPAMSHGVQTVIEARFGDADSALDRWRRYVESRIVHPGLQIGEFDPSYGPARPVFVTGCADIVNGVLYGFLGARISDREPVDVAFKVRLNRGYWLSIDPNLPSDWEGIKLEPLRILGRNYRVTATHDRLEVVPL